MADVPDQQPVNPQPENLHPTNATGELQLETSTSSNLPPPSSSIESAHTSSVEPVKHSGEGAAHWLHLEPDVTRAVISRTEEELLSGLSALMRNRVENEKAQRMLATTMQEIEEAKKELLSVKDQIRTAEGELGARVKEHDAAREEIAATQQKLQLERSRHIEHQEAWFKTRQELEDSRRNVQSAASELGETQETARLMKAQISELKKEITRLLGERESMLAQIQPIRDELDQRLVAREAVIDQVRVLHQQVQSLTDEKSNLTQPTPEQTNERAQLQRELEQTRGEIGQLRQEGDRLRSDHERLGIAKHNAGAELSDVQGRLNSLRFSHAELLEQIYKARQSHAELQDRITQATQSHSELLENIEEAKHNLTQVEQKREEAVSRVVQPEVIEAVKEPEPRAEPEPPVPPAVLKVEAKPEPGPVAEPVEQELPLFLTHPTPPVASSWDSYVLESEFFTEETLDAPRVAELVTSLPGIEHSLIVQQFGPLLADRFPQRLHALFQVPRRDYALLYDRLPNKVRDYANLATRVSTYQIGDEFLTLSGQKDVFLAVTHEAPSLRPGLPEKIALVAEELGKMYPGPVGEGVRS